MKYNFDEIIPRRGSNSYKWDSATDEEVLPMWVADMDFRTAPPVIETLTRRVQHGIFGYTRVPDAYYRAVTDWFARRHKWQIEKTWIVYTTGVVPALSAILKALTVPGDRIIIQTPVYNCFFSTIRNNGCEIVASPLLREGNTYHIDFDDLERKAADEKTKIFILCNPHNPVGRIWTREELTRIGEICLRHHVFVIADEIHCELVRPGLTYTPFASLGEDFLQHSATCVSPSKAFNLAGLQIANIIIADGETRTKVSKAISLNEIGSVNPFGVDGLIAAYNEGGEWLDQLNIYLHENYRYMKEFCETRLPQFPITDLQGTYLVWMDCSVLGKNSEELEHLLIDNGKLWLNAGTMYGSGGEGFMRWNIACPRSLLKKGLERFRHFVQAQAQ